MHSPLDQFKVIPLYEMNFLGYDVSLTNAGLAMLVAVAAVMSFLLICVRRTSPIPHRMQAAGEIIASAVEDMVASSVGDGGKKYFPIIFTLFMFILGCNLLGMIPYGFTATSHIIVTFAMAITVFIVITLIGFIKHGLHYFSLFLPEGTPLPMAPLMVVIELFAYLARPVILSVRLAANMMAGHIVLKVVASFVIMAGVLGILPFGLLLVLQGFEIFVAILQAYVFTILTCAYLSDAVNLH
jgi:F-type H+-transporting ATPase subunit a